MQTLTKIEDFKHKMTLQQRHVSQLHHKTILMPLMSVTHVKITILPTWQPFQRVALKTYAEEIKFMRQQESAKTVERIQDQILRQQPAYKILALKLKYGMPLVFAQTVQLTQELILLELLVLQTHVLQPRSRA